MAENVLTVPSDVASPSASVERVGGGRHGRRPRSLSLATGLGLFIGGIAAIAIALLALDLSAAVQVVVVGVGATVAYRGLDLVARTLFGASFETSVWLCGLWLTVVALSAILAGVLPLSESKDVSKTLLEPVLVRPDLLSKHPLGTDKQGLDILGGLVYGARVSLVVGLGAAFIGMTIGSLIGISAGYFKGRFDAVVGLLSDSMLAFPPLILLLAMVSVLQPSVRNVTIALAVLGIPTYIRLSRANTILFSEREFVLAARSLGAKSRRIIFRELLPNVLLPVLSFAFVGVALLIVAEASLSFLGLSIKRPNPTWGNMIAAGQDNFDKHPHLVFVPGTILFITVYALNRVGDKARSLWDNRQSRL
ncbi:MAG: ABC transporter permease [Acidimicrobiia bacterium]